MDDRSSAPLPSQGSSIIRGLGNTLREFFESPSPKLSMKLLSWIYGPPKTVADWLSRLSSAVIFTFAALIIVGLFFIHLRSALSSQHFTPFSLVEETAYTLISAQNFLKYGFLNSSLLQDFSTSATPLDHPYVYDHMPAGPDITQALVLKLTNGSYEASRIIFSLSALIGFVIYYLFVRKFLARFGLRGAGVALLVPGAWQIIQLFERQIYSPFCILCFLPLYMYLNFLEDGRTWRLMVAAIFAFLSSIYLEYTVLAAISASWFGFFITRLIPIRPTHFLLIAASIAAGVFLHLIQNLYYLGWTNFALELGSTLSNRITGYPSPEDLQSFYRSIGVLHHGSRPVIPNALLAQLNWNFDFPGAGQIGLLFFSCLLILLCTWALRRRNSVLTIDGKADDSTASALIYDTRFFFRLAMWVTISVIASILLFPAFSQEVTIRGSVGPFFLGIGVAAVFDYSIRLFGAYCIAFAGTLIAPLSSAAFTIDKAAGSVPAVLRILTVTTCLLALSILLRSTLSFTSSNAVTIQAHWRMIQGGADAFGPPYDLLSDIDRFSGQPFMTNINAPAVGLFTQSVGFGVCAPESIQRDRTIKLEKCKILMARRYEYWHSVRPKYFVYTEDRRLFPGFADCLPANTYVGQSRREASCMEDLLSRLTTQYPLVMKNDLVRVFDLSLPVKNAVQ
jgi:hypothetical protein